jgi:hypothetical protein
MRASRSLRLDQWKRRSIITPRHRLTYSSMPSVSPRACRTAAFGGLALALALALALT